MSTPSVARWAGFDGQPIQADAENLGDATYVHITGPAGIPAGIHEVRIGDRRIRLYVNVTQPLPGTDGESEG